MDTKSEKIAWLVEACIGGMTTWLYVHNGVLGWTSIANDALKFADKQSAQSVVEMFPKSPVFATEHSWPEGY